ncbi:MULTISPECIES: ABC transporter permease [unclassified Paenibacillus]|uniref:ABC transporter permease n=1 Tax=unclassified Paenibacillus TaxID=185978 RepID=UPI00076DDE76|nr:MULTISPECIES: ABC transporter permease [unclassified Paenibacillus]KUP20992.1 ABC transporter permease [Paenibacillus sp. DMB5]MDF9843889.1 putative ABC transport system permease protein [Paenibacillus sp. PastF-2]MDF9850427.1 putative ABC transport system permease protein [Paenibacillus sp. PastM-2]MDF9857068.1 putative ABC transport system permease protein [Paenibacillus sp. PastF-1]MDH6482340.1 putative ABC transport system permease protein [Paenibacillus sp. PastH-2]
MMLYQSMKMAIKSILSSKVRAFLTMLGIIIGVSSVIALVSVGQGTTSQITESLSSLGTNQLTVSIMGRGATTSLTYEEALALGEIEGVENVSPVISGNVTAKHGTENVSVSVEGITPAYEDVQNFHVQSGRFLLDIDTEYRQKVALIGSDTAEDLFGTDSPVGERIQLNGTSFKIVGLLESKGSTSGGSSDEKILIPISTAERFLQSKGVRSITITTTSNGNVEEVKTKLESTLDAKFSSAENAYSVFDSQEMLETVNETSATLSLALGGIAGISLFVGGIGIMNIMIVSVNERTREIGIRKAIGAKKINILMQFMIESVVLSGLGGLIGVGLGLGASWAVGNYTSMNVATSWNMVLISFSFSLIIGIVFGMIPANKAARMRPIYALRND